MSSICTASTVTLPNSNNKTNTDSNNMNNNSNNSNENQNNMISSVIESQEILNNLKLIKEKIESNGVRDRDSNDVINKCCNNGFKDIQNNANNCHNIADKKSLQIDLSLDNDVIDDNIANDSDLEYSQSSTLSSSPVTSPIDETFGALNESLLEQKFSKLAITDLSRTDSPVIQINGANSFDDDDEEGYIEVRAPLLRSTSLKTGKTPPGTPHRKKIVRFADALGLDLESVRHIITDDLPTVPQSAFGALKLANGAEQTNGTSKAVPWFMQKQVKSGSPPVNRPNLNLEFIQPSSLLNFMDRVRNNKVCLENCVVSNSAGNLSITCIIRVLNVSFEKAVTLRYTLNEWLTWNEALASHMPNSCDGFSDKFTVTFSVSAGGYYLSPGQRLLFALKYTANAEEYWDNNMGLNYSLIYRF